MHLEKLKKEIEQLSDEEFGQLRRWFAEKELVRSHVPYPDLETVYEEMAQDEDGRVLLVRRSDNGAWVMPAGSIELEESISDCVTREVREETSLTVRSAYPIAIYSEP